MRLFWVGNPDLDQGVAILASTVQEAKICVWRSGILPEEWKWVNVRAIWIRYADISNLEQHGKGYILSYEEGVAAGAYCDECETDVTEDEQYTDGICDLAPQTTIC